MASSNPRKRVAIVGSGAGGMGALYSLRDAGHEVHLYEADSRLGGHTNTVPFRSKGQTVQVDTGFFVLNTATYPNFIAMLRHLSVETMETVMTFSVSRNWGEYEWAGTNLATVFAQRENLWNPRTWTMLADIVRFNLSAIDLLATETEATNDPSTGHVEVVTGLQETLGSYLARNHYSEPFINDYLLPMTAAVWSTPPDKCALEFPAVTLVRFMWNHHLLSTVSARPPWLTIKGGSKTYIKAILDYFPQAEIHLNAEVKSVTPRRTTDDKVKLDLGDRTEEFDHIILATHGDTARLLLGDRATSQEAKILDCFTTVKNEAVLHGDMTLMPTLPSAHAAWNILSLPSPTRPSTISSAHSTKTLIPSLSTSKTYPQDQQVSLTYNMTLLQSLPPQLGPILVTLNPPIPPAQKTIQYSTTYTHPLYTPAAIHAQSLLPSIQHKRGISYAGSWTKYGFHEDGFSSGLKVGIDALGGSVGNGGRWVDATTIRGKERGWVAWGKRKMALVLLAVLVAWSRLAWFFSWPLRVVIGILLGSSVNDGRVEENGAGKKRV